MYNDMGQESCISRRELFFFSQKYYLYLTLVSYSYAYILCNFLLILHLTYSHVTTLVKPHKLWKQ